MAVLAGFNTLALLGSAFIFYCIGLVLYRLILSLLSKFPGPKFAAATLWYEFYYEVVKRGQLTFKIQEWHRKFGPIIRINPYEIHVDDPEFYSVLFSTSGIRNKDEFYTAQFGTPLTAFGAVAHDVHRMRRQPLNPFFSKASIIRLMPVISSMIDKLCSRLDEFKGTGYPLDMRLVCTCLGTEVVTRYTLNTSMDLLDSPDFSPAWRDTLKNLVCMTKWTKQFPWLFTIFNNMPDCLVKTLNPGLMLVLNMKRDIIAQSVEIMEGKEPNSNLTGDELLPRTILHALWNNPSLPSHQKTLDHLGQAGQDIVAAGSESVANALAVTTFYLLSTPRALERLKGELKRSMPDRSGKWELNVVEGLPYLRGVVLEGLRLFYGVSGRLSRIAPHEVLNCKGWEIPAGTPISMSSVIMHHDERVFPDSHSFLPERWADAPDCGRGLERYLVTFSKGSRNCIGQNLAKAELFLTLATLFSRYDMQLYGTTFERDVQLKSDCFAPMPSWESKGIRVIFK